MAEKGFVIVALALTMVIAATAMVSCDDGSDSGGTSFDGSTLSGTTWEDIWVTIDGKITITYKFTSGTAGKRALTGSDKYAALLNGSFTCTYDARANTGTIMTTKSLGPDEEIFTVDVIAKTLSVTSTSDETTVLHSCPRLQRNATAGGFW